MIEFFTTVVNAIGSIFSFIGMFVSSIMQVFVLVGKGLAYIVACIAFMPPILSAFLMAFIGLSVIYLIVGR